MQRIRKISFKIKKKIFLFFLFSEFFYFYYYHVIQWKKVIGSDVNQAV